MMSTASPSSSTVPLRQPSYWKVRSHAGNLPFRPEYNEGPVFCLGPRNTDTSTRHRASPRSLVLALPVSAQSPNLADRLPIDTLVVRGKLPNGVQYLIRRNAKPEKRAELRLVGERRLDPRGRRPARARALRRAHGVQRHARAFRRSDIVELPRAHRHALRRRPQRVHVVRRDGVHARRSRPTRARARARRSHILEDWAHGITFDSEEVAEGARRRHRGVAARARAPTTRMRDKQFPVLFQGSRYAERLPIGDDATILETLRRRALARASIATGIAPT